MQVSDVLQNHPYISSAVITWIFNNIVTNAITSMPAPTKDSSAKYVWFFKFANGVLAGNLKRAQGSHVEDSPNWQDAVEKHIANGNGGQTPGSH